MHEYSIITSLIEMCESHAKANNAISVAKVCVAIGERSGVDSALIESAFETFKLDSVFMQQAKLELSYQPVILQCQQCEQSFQSSNLSYSNCPHCQSQNVIITQGKELHLLSLELDIPS